MRFLKHMVVRRQSQAVFLLLFAQSIHADTTELRSLDFGSIAILSNNTQEFIRISHTGIVGTSSAVLVITPPTTGEFLLTNFPANKRLHISGQSLLPSSTSTQYSVEQFSLDSIDVPSVIFSDANGSATLPVGGTLVTSGSGNNAYVDTDYRIPYQITINY